MRIPDLIAASEEPCFSFEFFPPKTEEGVAELFASVEDLNRLEPSFVSVTYGAGGSTREGTVEITTRIKREYGIETMAHLSVVGETIAGLDAILGRLDAAGIENVLALRGDPPRGEPDFTPPPGGLTSSAELAAFIRGREATARFGIGASCFPEIHPEAASPEADIAFLREKVEAGAEFLISQLFFDNAVYFDWVEQV
ncbi:MAG: methylenetetrahydrofolate reductase, partial [Thermoleophilia bacterium]|nr:methylenetetrahydrofolate reductase [Thermoleophilia bacterium]